MTMASVRKHRSKKRRHFKAYAYDYLRLSRLDAVRDLGDHRRWTWIAFPERIGDEPDTFSPTTDDGYAEYKGHWEFSPKFGRCWKIDWEKTREATEFKKVGEP